MSSLPFPLLLLLAPLVLSALPPDSIKVGDLVISTSGLSQTVPPIPSANIYEIASYYGLTTSFAYPFPSSPIAAAVDGAPLTPQNGKVEKFNSLIKVNGVDLAALINTGKAASFFGDEEGGEPSSLFQPASLVSLKNVSQYPAFAYMSENWNVSNPKGPSGGQAYNVAFVPDPVPRDPKTTNEEQSSFTDGEVGNTDTMVLAVSYPEGSFSGNNEGGITFWSKVLPPGTQTAMFTYDIAFSDKFDFVKGGKLPGFYGNKNHERFGSCSGGKHSVDCLSTRLMWRPKGSGEVYAYIPTYDGLCRSQTLGCNPIYGMSVSRGSYKFDSKSWNTIALVVSLNTPNINSSQPMLTTNNGLVALYHNNDLKMYHDNLVLRTEAEMQITAVDFTTFFGGSDSSWATGKGGATTYFRNMKVFYSNSSSILNGTTVLATASPGKEEETSPATPRFGYQPAAQNCFLLMCLLPPVLSVRNWRW